MSTSMTTRWSIAITGSPGSGNLDTRSVGMADGRVDEIHLADVALVLLLSGDLLRVGRPAKDRAIAAAPAGVVGGVTEILRRRRSSAPSPGRSTCRAATGSSRGRRRRACRPVRWRAAFRRKTCLRAPGSPKRRRRGRRALALPPPCRASTDSGSSRRPAYRAFVSSSQDRQGSSASIRRRAPCGTRSGPETASSRRRSRRRPGRRRPARETTRPARSRQPSARVAAAVRVWAPRQWRWRRGSECMISTCRVDPSNPVRLSC